MRRSIACACGERTIAANVCLGSVKSSPNVPDPVIKRWSSRRRGELPIPGLVMLMFPEPIQPCSLCLTKAVLFRPIFAKSRRNSSVAGGLAIGLYPSDLFSAEESERPHKQHCNERKIGRKRSASPTQLRVQITRGQALQHANKYGCDDRPRNTVETANDHDGKDF